MAQKRMFSRHVVDTDNFMDLPTSAQALYFHLGMHADDDGFVASPRKIARAAGCNDDDTRLLVSRGFVIPFDSGVVVITDWKINNAIKRDRYTETIYLNEKAMLSTEKSGRYQLGTSLEPLWNQNGSGLAPQYSIGKDSIGKDSIGEIRKEEDSVCAAEPPQNTHAFSPPSVDDVRAYCEKQGYSTIDPERFISYYGSRGWMIGQTAITDWRAAVDTWNRKDTKEQHGKSNRPRLQIGTVV